MEPAMINAMKHISYLKGRQMAIRQLTATILFSVLLTTAGCAPAYHWYDECRVPCKYCAPNPLPYSTYCGCPCHSNAAEPYLMGRSPELVNPSTLPDAIEMDTSN